VVLALQFAGRMLTREAAARRRSMIGELIAWAVTWAVVVGVLAVLAIGVVGSIDFGHDDDAKIDIAKLTVSKLAHEAYPQWSRDHKGCPHSLAELTEYMDTPRTTDPWGQRYRMFCSGGLLIVASSGEDRIPNTADDRWSNQ